MIAPRDGRGRRRRRRPLLPWLAALAAVAAVFAAGIALGMALHDNPQPGLSVTATKTVVP